MGIALICFGAYGIFQGYAAGEISTSAIGFAGIIGGALLTLFGFGKRVNDRVQQPGRELSDRSHAEVKALIQSMGVVAVADQLVREREVQAISNVYERMLGIRISEEEIREILSEFGPDFDIAKRLNENRSMISPEMKRMIIQSCHLVMVSDLEVVKPEENRIFEIGMALGFDAVEIDDLIASAEI